MLEVASARIPEAEFLTGDALDLPFEDGSFDRILTGHFYGHLEEEERVRFLGEARRVARELVVVDSALHDGVEPVERQERVLKDGSRWEVYKRYFSRPSLAEELGGGEALFDGPLVRRRALARLTRRRSSYRSLASLQRDNRACRACAEAGYPIESLPVLEGHAGQRAYILGQAPGIVEGEERRPWRGRAGQTLRRWLRHRRGRVLRDVLLRVGDALLPGTRGGRRRRPDADGARAGALRVLARMGARARSAGADRPGRRPGHPQPARDRRASTPPSASGSNYGDAVAVPLPHPSGVSRWMNLPENRRRVERAVELVHAELRALS